MSYFRIVYAVVLIVGVIALFSGITIAQSESSTKLEIRGDGNSVYLSWQSPELSSKATYNIYRAPAPDLTMALEPSQLNFSRINTVTVAEYVDKLTSVSDEGNIYVYYVAAVNDDGTESAGSNYVNIKVGGTKTGMSE